MIIRDARDDDNIKMLDIHLNAPQVGEFEILLIRSNFQTKCKFFSDGFYLVAEDEETSDLMGFLGVGIHNFKVKGKIYKGAYFYDLRTNCKYRNKISRWLKSIIEVATNRLIKIGIDFYFASIKKDNEPSMKLIKHFDLKPIFNYKSYSIPVYNKKISSEVKIEESFDLEGLENIFSARNQENDFLPIDLKDTFFKVTKEENRLIKFSYKSAEIIGWDTKDIDDIGIANMSGRFKIIFKVLCLTAKIIPIVRAPILHKGMKSFHIIKFNYQDKNDFKLLLQSLSGYCYKNGFYIISIFLPENQFFNENILGKLTFRVDLTIVANSVNNVDFSNLKNLIWLPII